MNENNPAKNPSLNTPNCITLSRLFLAIILFGLLAFGWVRVCLFLFIFAASTDWLDGYLARKWGEVTTLGRVLDPFVDKVIVLGAFIFLLPMRDTGLAAWMVTVIVARELLVTGLRSFLEGESIAFGADWAGKIKMAVQCVAISWILFCLGYLSSDDYPELKKWAEIVKIALVWFTVGITAYSGGSYSLKAARLIQLGKLSSESGS